MGSRSPVRTPVVACTIARSAGSEMGKSSRGRRSSRLRARRPRAAKKVPLTTSAQVPRGMMSNRRRGLPGGGDGFDDDDVNEIGEGFADEQGGGGRGCEALGVEDLVADLAGPGLVECG